MMIWKCPLKRTKGFLCIIIWMSWYDNLFSDIDECHSSPCLNGAICYDRFGKFICSCSRGFDGINCEIGKLHYTFVSIHGPLIMIRTLRGFNNVDVWHINPWLVIKVQSYRTSSFHWKVISTYIKCNETSKVGRAPLSITLGFVVFFFFFASGASIRFILCENIIKWSVY